MTRSLTNVLLVSAVLAVVAGPGPQAVGAATHGGPLLQQDFNLPDAWPGLAAAPALAGMAVEAVRASVGTVDTAGSTTPSGAIRLTVRRRAGGGAWSGAMTSGLLPVHTAEKDLGKLTLSFDHSVSSVRPVTVRVESFDVRKRRTGGREGTVYPAAPNFYLRAALELSAMRPFGGGAFRPTDPFVRITFRISRLPAGSADMGAADAGPVELRIDNVCYASPAYYVSPHGSDASDGRTEAAAFATPQKAVDAAQPGDIILVMGGTYLPHSDQEGVAAFRRPGAPAAWITLKNYPGQHPVLSTVGAWNAVRIGQRGTQAVPSPLPALAYLELRGLHFRGDADAAKQKYADLIGKSDPHTNGNGVSITGGNETHRPHHIRLADNVADYCAGGGLSAIQADWITIEDNVARNNCWWTVYATSGISLLDSADFDAGTNVYKCLIRGNQSSGNRCFVPWGQVKRISDGNGIIIDTNNAPAKHHVYLGRTLVQNNLSFNNGGSGIHAFKSHQMDIINNTAYDNGASPELKWGQIFVQVSDDVRMMNNILVSRPGQPINSVGPDGGDQNSTRVTRTHNLYFGGLAPKLTGPGDVTADPQFVNASADPALANFHLKPVSPARRSGLQGETVPLLDLDGRPRPTNTPPDRGAY